MLEYFNGTPELKAYLNFLLRLNSLVKLIPVILKFNITLFKLILKTVALLKIMPSEFLSKISTISPIFKLDLSGISNKSIVLLEKDSI